MFDISSWELMIIAIVALIVIGPQRLPDVARTVGRWVGRIRRFVVNVKADIDREIQQEELKKAIERDAGLDEIKQIMNTERFTLEDEVPGEANTQSEYAVTASQDDEAEASKIIEQQNAEFDEEEEITSNETGHYDAADMDYDTIEHENTAAKDK